MSNAADSTGGGTAGSRLPAAPPWVWLWIVFFLHVPFAWLLQEEWKAVVMVAESHARLQEVLHESTFDFVISLWPMGAELAPFLVLVLGIAFSFVPALARMRNIDRRGAAPISPDYPSPIVQAIRSEIQGIHPRLASMACLSVPGIAALASPIDFRRSAVVVGGALPPIWRRDPNVGRAILVHEVTHWRQGEARLLNVGSPLVDALRAVPILVALFIVLPILFMIASGVLEMLQFAREFNANSDQLNAVLGAHPSGEAIVHRISYYDIISYVLNEIVTLNLPSTLSMLGSWICLVLWPVTSLVAAFWVAEMIADRAAAESVPADYAAALSRTGRSGSPIDRVRDLMIHPPLRLRCWAARGAKSPMTLLLILVMFPAGIVVGQFSMVIWKWLERFEEGWPNFSRLWSDTIDWLPGGVAHEAHRIALPLLICGVAMIVWPLVSPLLGRQMGLPTRRGEAIWPYGVAACLCFVGCAAAHVA